MRAIDPRLGDTGFASGRVWVCGVRPASKSACARAATPERSFAFDQSVAPHSAWSKAEESTVAPFHELQPSHASVKSQRSTVAPSKLADWSEAPRKS